MDESLSPLRRWSRPVALSPTTTTVTQRCGLFHNGNRNNQMRRKRNSGVAHFSSHFLDFFFLNKLADVAYYRGHGRDATPIAPRTIVCLIYVRSCTRIHLLVVYIQYQKIILYILVVIMSKIVQQSLRRQSFSRPAITILVLIGVT